MKDKNLNQYIFVTGVSNRQIYRILQAYFDQQNTVNYHAIVFQQKSKSQLIKVSNNVSDQDFARLTIYITKLAGFAGNPKVRGYKKITDQQTFGVNLQGRMAMFFIDENNREQVNVATEEGIKLVEKFDGKYYHTDFSESFTKINSAAIQDHKWRIIRKFTPEEKASAKKQNMDLLLASVLILVALAGCFFMVKPGELDFSWATCIIGAGILIRIAFEHRLMQMSFYLKTLAISVVLEAYALVLTFQYGFSAQIAAGLSLPLLFLISYSMVKKPQ